MTKTGSVIAAASLLAVISSAAFADTPAGQVRAEQIRHDRVTAARENAHAATAMANGHTIVANRLDARAANQQTAASGLATERQTRQLAASRRTAFRSLRDQERATYDANHGMAGKAAFLRGKSAMNQQRSNNLRGEYGKTDINDQPRSAPASSGSGVPTGSGSGQ